MPHTACGRECWTTRQQIHRLTTLAIVTIAFPLSVHAYGPGGDGDSRRRPNVIVILTDDQGYGDLACHGNRVIKTPNLDRLFAGSVRLTDFHVSPACAPTRAALMTGRSPSRVGVWHVVMGRCLLHEDELTMADILLAGGYRTAIFGKWHLGDNCPFRPQDRGFQEVLVHGRQGAVSRGLLCLGGALAIMDFIRTFRCDRTHASSLE